MKWDNIVPLGVKGLNDVIFTPIKLHVWMSFAFDGGIFEL